MAFHIQGWVSLGHRGGCYVHISTALPSLEPRRYMGHTNFQCLMRSWLHLFFFSNLSEKTRSVEDAVVRQSIHRRNVQNWNWHDTGTLWFRASPFMSYKETVTTLQLPFGASYCKGTFSRARELYTMSLDKPNWFGRAQPPLLIGLYLFFGQYAAAHS
jgi:hypothetical protein